MRLRSLFLLFLVFNKPYSFLQGFGDGHALTVSSNSRSLIVGSLTLQCPDIAVPSCRSQASALYQNLWRFELFSDQQPQQASLPEEELLAAGEKRGVPMEDFDQDNVEQWLREWSYRP